MLRNSKQIGKLTVARVLAKAGVIAGVIVAGAGTGYLVSTALAGEGPGTQTGYCLYLVDAPVPPTCSALHACAFGGGNAYYAEPDYNNQPCNTHNVVVCGPNLTYLEHSSSTCPSP